MAISHFGTGTVASAASGNITPTLPAGFATNDIGILICSQHDNVASTIGSSWTIVDAANNTTAMRGWWAWKRLTAGEGNPTITHSGGDAIIARISVFSGCVTSGNPYNANSALNTAATATANTTAITPTTALSEIVFAIANSDDCTFASYSGTNPTWTERIDNLTTSGADASIALAHGNKSDTTSTGARTATASRTSGLNRSFLIALTPAPDALITGAYWGIKNRV